MSPDNKRYFVDLRRTAEQEREKEKRRLEQEKKEREIEMQRAKAITEARAIEAARIRTRREQADSVLTESGFLAVLQELDDLLSDSKKGGLQYLKNAFPAYTLMVYGSGSKPIEGYSVPDYIYKQKDDNSFIGVVWGTADYLRIGPWNFGFKIRLGDVFGMAIEATAEGDIYVVGADTQILRESDWRDNPEAQGLALERAYYNPFKLKFWRREGDYSHPYVEG